MTLSDSIEVVLGDGAGQEVLLLDPVAGMGSLFAACVEAAGAGTHRFDQAGALGLASAVI